MYACERRGPRWNYAATESIFWKLKTSGLSQPMTLARFGTICHLAGGSGFMSLWLVVVLAAIVPTCELPQPLADSGPAEREL
jgi:hypothetical protein